MFRRFISLCLTALMLSSMCFTILADDSGWTTSSNTDSSETVTVRTPLQGMELVAKTDILELYLDAQNGFFAVKNKITGYIWQSNPLAGEADTIAKGINRTILLSQLVIRTVSETFKDETIRTSYNESVNAGNFSAEKTENGFISKYNFSEVGIVVPLEVTLDTDKLSVNIPADKIEEKSDSRITRIALLPYFGAGTSNDSGYIFVPDGSGGLINFNNKKINSSYEQSIYGEDISVSTNIISDTTKKICLPVFGIKNGNDAFVAVVKNSAGLGTIYAASNGNISSYNSVYSSFRLRSMDMQIITSEISQKVFEQRAIKAKSLSVDYIFLNNQGASYVGMAKRYREDLLSKGLLKENANVKRALVLNAYGSVVGKKLFFGIPIDTSLLLTSYDDSAKIVNELNSNGVKYINYNFINAEDNQVNGMIQKDIKPIPALGGKEKFTKMIRAINEKNMFYLNSNSHFIKSDGNGFSNKEGVAKDVGQQRVALFSNNLITGNKTNLLGYLMKPLAATDNLANNIINSYKKFNLNGFSSNQLADLSYSDFYKKKNISKDDNTKEMVLSLKLLKQSNMNVMVSGGFSYAFQYADYINNAPVTGSRFNIIDEEVPFYQLVVSGAIGYSTQALNQTERSEDLFLKAISTGADLSFTIISGNPNPIKNTSLNFLYSCQYQYWKDEIIDKSNQIQAVNEKTENSELINYETISDNVYKSTFKNGAVIFVNYSRNDCVLDNGMVIKAKSYILIGGKQ